MSDMDEDDIVDRDTEVRTDSNENLQTLKLKEKFGHMEIEIEDRYKGTKISGPDVDRFLNKFNYIVKVPGNKFTIHYLSEDAVSIRFLDD